MTSCMSVYVRMCVTVYDWYILLWVCRRYEYVTGVCVSAYMCRFVCVSVCMIV